MSTTIRKNFVFDINIAKHLEELAQETKQSMTAIIQELIEERYKQIKVKKRLEVLEKMRSSANGLLTDFSVQSTKASREL